MPGLNFDITANNAQFIEQFKAIQKEVAKAQSAINSFNSNNGATAMGNAMARVEQNANSAAEATERVAEAQEHLNESIQESEKVSKDGTWGKMGESAQDAGKQVEEAGKHIEETGKKTEEAGKSISSLAGGSSNLSTMLGFLPPQISGVVTKIQSLTAAAEAFVATPLGLILAALAVVCAEVGAAFKMVEAYLTGTLEGQQKMVKVTGLMNGIMGTAQKVIALVGERLWKLAERLGTSIDRFPRLAKAAKFAAQVMTSVMMAAIDGLVQGFEQLEGIIEGVGKITEGDLTGAIDVFKNSMKNFAKSNSIGGLVNFAIDFKRNWTESGKIIEDMVGNIDNATKLAQDELNLKMDEILADQKIADLEKQIAETRNKIYETQDKNERKRLIEEQLALIDEKTELNKGLQKARVAIANEALAITPSSLEDYGKAIQARTGLTRIETAGLQEKRFAQRMLSGIEASQGRANSGEQKRMSDKEYARIMDEGTKELLRAEADRQIQLAQAEIDGMQDGAEKAQQQRELEHEKALLQITRQAEDQKTAIIKASKAQWEAANTTPFDIKKFLESSDYTKQAEEIEKLALAKTDALNLKFEKSQTETEAAAMLDYLKAYGTYQQQKLAIAQEYAEKIRKAQTEGERLKLGKERDKKLDAMNADRLASQIDFASIFSNLGILIREPLENAAKELREFVKTDKFKQMSPTDQKTTMDALLQAESRLGGSLKDLNFKKVGKDINAYSTALQELKKRTEEEEAAQARLAKANEKLEEALKSENAAAIESATANKAAAEATLEVAQNATNEAQQNVTTANNNLTDSASKLNNALTDVEKYAQAIASGSASAAWKALPEQARTAVANAISKVLGGKSDLVSQIIGAVLSVLDLLKDGIGHLIQGIVESLGAAIGGIIREIFSGNILTNIGSGIKDAMVSIIDGITVGGFSSWTTTGNAAEVNRITEENTKRIEYLTNSVDALKEEMEKNRGGVEKTLNAYEQAVENQKGVIDATQSTLQAQMGYTSAHHSNSYYINKNFSDELWQRISEAASKAGQGNVSVSNAGELFALTPEQIKAIQTYDYEAYQKIAEEGKYDKSEYLEDYIKLADSLDELTESLKESLTGTTFDAMYDSFVSNLMDMNKSAEDFSDDFAKYMQQAMLNSAIGEMLNEEMQSWYNDWADKMKNGSLTQSDIDSMRTEWDTFVENGINLRDSLAEITGYGEDSYSSTSTAKSVASMSQDTAEELNGRFTAIQISNESINQQMIMAVTHLATLNAVCTANSQVLQEMQTAQALGNEYLLQIVGHTKRLESIENHLDSMDYNIKNKL